MKPRRWYSSPELDPNPTSPARPFPAAIYWAYATLTSHKQGAIIKRELPPATEANGRREPGVRLAPPRVRRIDAA